jgi:hypothetical protein
MHVAYRWVCGGVSVNYHIISDFRSALGAALDDLFAQVLAMLMHQGLVSLSRVAQDGTRVRASAGAASFRRAPTLRHCLAEAVVQDAQSYQQLLDSAARADVYEAVRQGVDDIVHGRTRPARKVFNELRRRHGVSR